MVRGGWKQVDQLGSCGRNPAERWQWPEPGQCLGQAVANVGQI